VALLVGKIDKTIFALFAFISKFNFVFFFPAVEAIDKIMTCNENATLTSCGQKINSKHAIVCLAAQMAFEQNERHVVVRTLRHLAASGNDDSAKLTAFR